VSEAVGQAFPPVTGAATDVGRWWQLPEYTMPSAYVWLQELPGIQDANSFIVLSFLDTNNSDAASLCQDLF
jgi:hypothetical protein